MVNIKRLRRALGLTQVELAERVNVTQDAISKYEGGKRRPSPEVAKRLAKVLNISWTEFFDDELQDGE